MVVFIDIMDVDCRKKNLSNLSSQSSPTDLAI